MNVYKIKAYAESEACDSASVVPIHTRSEVSSDSDSASVASVNQPLEFLNGHGMRPLSGMKLNADGVCVMSGYEELLRDDEFAGDA